MSVDTKARRNASRPLRDLTDRELVALTEVGRISGLLRDFPRTELQTLAEFAYNELDERELAAALDAHDLEGGSGGPQAGRAER